LPALHIPQPRSDTARSPQTLLPSSEGDAADAALNGRRAAPRSALLWAPNRTDGPGASGPPSSTAVLSPSPAGRDLGAAPDDPFRPAPLNVNERPARLGRSESMNEAQTPSLQVGREKAGDWVRE